MNGKRLPVVPTLCMASVVASSADPPSNIIFILVDDQRHDALSCLRHPFLTTPAADALVKDGLRFADAFVTTSLCSPDRSSIRTAFTLTHTA